MLGTVRRDLAYVVVAAVDVGILNLTNYRPPAPDDYADLTYTPMDAQGRVVGPTQEAAIRPRQANTGNREPQYANVRFKDDFNPPPVRGKQVTRSVGTVLHLASWLNPAVNFSETFNPPGSIVRIDGRQLEPGDLAGILTAA